MSNVKTAVVEVLQSLPNDVTWDEVLYRLEVRRQLELAVAEADQGIFLSHEDVFRELEAEEQNEQNPVVATSTR
ncbi:MAG TPA: hypothetical protein VK137_18340 [Planctomycetaceae bacterium]|nr:hypothetical protein [Planctomycetaceae bacterium]